MTLRSHPLPPIPEATVATVQAAFPEGNPYMALRAEFGALYDDQLFADLYPPAGRPVEIAPWRLALVMVMQYIEGLTDRQAADAVRRCMDWKYALSLDLTDPGFDFTLLQQFPLMACKSSVTSGSGEISHRFDHPSSSLGETFTIRHDRRACSQQTPLASEAQLAHNEGIITWFEGTQSQRESRARLRGIRRKAGGGLLQAIK